MDQVCKKCGNNLYGNRLKCPFCGHPINSSSKTIREPRSANTYSYNKSTHKPNTNATQSSTVVKRTSKSSFGLFEVAILLVISFFVPPLGFVFFMAYSKDKKNFATMALIVGIIGLINYFN